MTAQDRTAATKRRKGVDISYSVHRDVPACCRSALRDFAINDRYHGGGEPGDRIGCDCGNVLVYDHRGWRLAA